MQVEVADGAGLTIYKAGELVVSISKGAHQVLVERDGEPVHGPDEAVIFAKLFHPENTFISRR